MKSIRKLRGRPPLFYSDEYTQRREQDIINIVRDNQPVHQALLLRMIARRHRLKTPSKARVFVKRMLDKRLIARVAEGKKMIYYYVPEVESINSAAIEGLMRGKVAILQREIARLRREYPDAPLTEKWAFTKSMAAMAFDGIKECNLLVALSEKPVKNPYKAEEQALRAAIREIVDIINADADAAFVFPLVRATLTAHRAPKELATRNLPYYPPSDKKKKPRS